MLSCFILLKLENPMQSMAKLSTLETWFSCLEKEHNNRNTTTNNNKNTSNKNVTITMEPIKICLGSMLSYSTLMMRKIRHSGAIQQYCYHFQVVPIYLEFWCWLMPIGTYSLIPEKQSFMCNIKYTIWISAYAIIPGSHSHHCHPITVGTAALVIWLLLVLLFEQEYSLITQFCARAKWGSGREWERIYMPRMFLKLMAIRFEAKISFISFSVFRFAFVIFDAISLHMVSIRPNSICKSLYLP